MQKCGSSYLRERFADLQPLEGAAILAFLSAIQLAQGADFPFDELDTAIEWIGYRCRSA